MDPDVATEEKLLTSMCKVGARGSASISEAKEKIKAWLGRSPDPADALAGYLWSVTQREALVLHWW